MSGSSGMMIRYINQHFNFERCEPRKGQYCGRLFVLFPNSRAGFIFLNSLQLLHFLKICGRGRGAVAGSPTQVSFGCQWPRKC